MKYKKISLIISFTLAIILNFANIIPLNMPNQLYAKCQISSNKRTMEVGETKTLKVRNAKNIKWSSNNKKVATVNQKGKVTAKKVGTAIITAKISKTRKATCKITVINPTVKSISLNNEFLTLKEGETYSLKATIKPSNATNKISWESTNPEIASVESGKVTAISEGETFIVAKVGDKNAICTVNVKENPDPIFSCYIGNDLGSSTNFLFLEVVNKSSKPIIFGEDDAFNGFLGIYYPYGKSYHTSAFLCNENWKSRISTYTVPAKSKDYLYVELKDKEEVTDSSCLFIPFTFKGENYYATIYKNKTGDYIKQNEVE